MKTKDYAELIGIGAVVASLLLLTYELRQNTVASQQAAAATYSDGWRDIELFGAGDLEFIEILARSIDGGELTGLERFRLDFFYRAVFRSWQNSYLQFRAGSLPEEIWNAELRFMSQLAPQEKGMQLYWRNEKPLYSDAFAKLFDSFLSDASQ